METAALSWGKMFVGLLVILILIVITVWVLKKLQGFQLKHLANMKILGGLSVGAKERITIVQIGDEQFLLGITPHSISKIHHFSKPIQLAEKLKSNTPFDKVLQSWLGKNKLQKGMK